MDLGVGVGWGMQMRGWGGCRRWLGACLTSQKEGGWGSRVLMEGRRGVRLGGLH